MKKVYCEDCRYYVVSNRGKELCYHKNNQVISDSYVRQVVRYNNTPMEINKDNDCPWFKKIGWWDLFN